MENLTLLVFPYGSLPDLLSDPSPVYCILFFYVSIVHVVGHGSPMSCMPSSLIQQIVIMKCPIIVIEGIGYQDR